MQSYATGEGEINTFAYSPLQDLCTREHGRLSRASSMELELVEGRVRVMAFQSIQVRKTKYLGQLHWLFDLYTVPTHPYLEICGLTNCFIAWAY